MYSSRSNSSRKLFAYVLSLLSVLIMCVLFAVTPAHAASGINQQINFQGRLLNAQGATVPDGFYNIQFKIYQDGDGQTVGNTTGTPAGSLKWTENHLNSVSQGVVVKNGFMSVQLGAVTPFGSSIDWNQDTLWLSMNIGNTNASCTPFTSCGPDGEMIPMKRLSSTPYALNSSLLGGLSSAQFIQSTTTLQTGNIAVQSAAAANVGALIQGASGQTADIFQVKANGVANPVMAVSAGGAITMRNSTDSASAFQVQNAAGASLLTVDSSASNISLLGNNTSTLSTWNTTTAMSVGANTNRVRGGTVTANGYIYYIGGVDGTGATIPTVQFAKLNADGTVGTWASTTALPDARRQVQPVVVNGYMYVIGGRNNSSTTTSTSYYAKLNADGTVGAWNTTTDLTSGGGARFGHGTVSYNGYIYVLGGYNTGVARQNTVYYAKINPNGTLASTWLSATPMSDSLGNINGTIVANGYIYVPGGDSTLSGGTSNSLLYAKLNPDGTVGSWTSQSTVLGGSGDENFETYIANGYLYVLGGDHGNRVTALPLNANGSVGSVTALTNFPLNPIGEGTMAQANGYLYVLGGSSAADGGGTVRNTVYYASTPRIKVGGNLDLVGYSGENLSEGGSGGQLTAGNTNIIGNLQVQDSASFLRGVSIGDSLSVGGSTAITANSTNALQVQPAGSSTPIFNVDTTNNQVVISTPTFSTTANDANCYTGGALVAASCTIATASVNTTSAIIVGFNQGARTASLPDPTLATAGKVVYITAANGSNDFTLLVNGGGTGNTIAMRQNTTATMIWNGNDWTAAGASSSTTLQSAYDNTLQSAGGAELIVSRTSNTNGLTIRDSSTNPVNDTLLSVQSSSAASLFSVNSNVKEYSSNSGAETAGGTSTTFPASTWSSIGATTVSRQDVAGTFIATGQGSVKTITPATANVGVKNTLSASLTANTNYNVSFTAKLASGAFTDMNVYYSIDGTAASIPCTLSQAVNTSVWTKVNCTFTTPASGITATNAILLRQTTGTVRTFYVDNLSVTIAADYNFATDSNVNDQTNFATNWLTAGLGTVGVTRNTSDGYNASDSAQAAVTAGAVNAGIRNKLSSNPLSDTLYRVTVYGKLMSGAAFTDFKVRYSYNGSTNTTLSNYVDCVDYSTQTLTTTGWTKVTCYIKTDSNTATNPHVYFAESTSAVRTFAVDAFSMTLSTSTTPNVQIGGGVNGGPTTLFTLDKGASAPIASDNDALLGSMYYDTTLGKLQCYEADGWGACGSSPDNVVTISPEYTNAVMHGTGVGTMTSDLCSDTLNINDGSSSQPTICGTNETYNFYKWTSPQPSAQTYSIYVTYQLPNTFKEFASGQTSLMGRTDNANATVNYQVYRSDASGLTACGSSVAVSSGVQTSWQSGIASGAADPSTCNFAPGNSIVFKINAAASNTANAYVGNLNFIFSNR